MTDLSVLPDFGSIGAPLWGPASGDLPLRDPTADDPSGPELEPTEPGVYDPVAFAAAIPVDILPVWDEDKYLSVSKCSVPEASRTAPSVYEQVTLSSPGWAMPSVHEQVTSSRMRAKTPLKGLNEQQAQTAVHEGAPLLITAGAGSGKIRVLIHHVAHLLATGRARLGEILTITSINKATAEMCERVVALVGPSVSRIWVSTLHSVCVRILRSEHKATGLRSTFTIYGAQDSQRLAQIIFKVINVNIKCSTTKIIVAKISDLKNELITAHKFAGTATSDPISTIAVDTYLEYSKHTRESNALGFDDLIMRTTESFTDNPPLAEHHHRRSHHILADGYQSMNRVQHVLACLLTGDGTDGVMLAELTIVGDSGQSIYAFRDAPIRNIEEFECSPPSARTILLEQSYHLTQNILSAVNVVIAKNEGRRPKNLWAVSGEGARIIMDAIDSERNEARLVIVEINHLHDADTKWGDVAVFYRTDAQLWVLEKLLVRQGIPHQVTDGAHFYKRREIKDTLAYLRAALNSDDIVALRRVLSVPYRGIEAKAEMALAAHVECRGISFGQAIVGVWEEQGRPEGKSEDIEWNLAAPVGAGEMVSSTEARNAGSSAGAGDGVL